MEKQELKKKYKNSEIPMGIYKITNLANGKIFVGSSRNLDARINRHKFELKFGSESNKELLNDIKQFGEKSFEFEIIDLLKYKDEPDYDYTEDLETLEELWKEKIKSLGKQVYNSN